MKHATRKAFLVASVLILSAGFMAFELQSSNGRAGYTNSPGENNCTNCHSQFAVNSGTGSIAISANPTLAGGYTPGATYAMTVTVSGNAPNNTLFGFGLEALNGSGANGGTLAITNPTLTQIKTFMVTPNLRNNVVHTGNGNVGPNVQSFSFNWTAPSTGSDTITFYAAGIAADNDGGTDGDYVYTTKLIAPMKNIVCDPPTNLFSSNVTSTSAKLHWTKSASAIRYEIRYRVLHATSWIIRRTKNNLASKNISGLTPGTAYLWKVRSLCADNPKIWSAWTASKMFTTPPVDPGRTLAIGEPSVRVEDPAVLSVYPSPAKDRIYLAVSGLLAEDAEASVYNTLGERVLQTGLDHSPFPVDISQWLPGVYIVRWHAGSLVLQKRFVKN